MCNFTFLKRLVTLRYRHTRFSKIILRVETGGRSNETSLPAVSRSPDRANESLVRFIRDVHEKKFAGLPAAEIARRNFICIVRRPARKLSDVSWNIRTQ